MIAVENNPDLITEVTDNWPQYKEYAKKYEVPDEQKFELLNQFTKKMLKKFPNANTIDGIRIEFGAGEWAIVRCSNTSSKISVRIEAKNSKSLETKKRILITTLETLIKKNLT